MNKKLISTKKFLSILISKKQSTVYPKNVHCSQISYSRKTAKVLILSSRYKQYKKIKYFFEKIS